MNRLFFLIPISVLMLAVIGPLLFLFIISFSSTTNYGEIIYWPFTMDNYKDVLSPLYLPFFVNSLLLASLGTFLCICFGFPMAYFISRSPVCFKNILLFLVTLPFFSNFLARIFSWFIILKPEGIFETWFGLEISNSTASVVLGMTYAYLPFMVLPIYSVLERLDITLIEAAADLGASQFRSFLKVVIPIGMPGVFAGAVMVFTPMLGEFLIPKFLGGGKIATLGTVIEDHFLGKTRLNWPVGAALTLILCFFVLLLLRKFKVKI